MEEGGPSDPWGDVIVLDDSDDDDTPMEDKELAFEEGHIVLPTVNVPVIDLDDDEDPEMGLGLEDLEEHVDDPDDEGIDWDDVLLHIDDPPSEGWEDDGDMEGDLLVEANEMALDDISEPEYDPTWDEPEEEEELAMEPVEVVPDQLMEAMMLDAVAHAQAANDLAHQYAASLASE